MVEVKEPNKLLVWLAPVAALLLIVGGGGALVWYWRGVSTPEGITLSPSLTAAINSPGGMSRTAIPPLQIAGKGSIIQFGVGASWNVTSGPFQMLIERPNGGTDFDYRYTVRRDQAFTGADLQLTTLAVQLMYNPLTQRQSGAPRSLVQQLRDKLGSDLLTPTLKISDADAQPLQNDWTDYLLAIDDATRQTSGTKLLDALDAAGQETLVDNRASFDAIVARIRELIPADKEALYRANIHKATVRPLPASRPATP